MTTAGPEPQAELIRELILTGDMAQLKGLLELEEGFSRDGIFKFGDRLHLILFGPLEHGSYVSWLVYYGYHQVLSGYRDSIILSGYRDKGHRTSFGSGRRQFSISPDMTLQQVYDYIKSRADPCEILRVAQVRAIPLPGGRLRLFFILGGFPLPPFFWRWVDGLTAELARLGFQPTPSLDAPPPPADEPEPLESIRSGWLAGQASGGAQPAAGRPWLQIPDVGWDRLALEYWWRGYTVSEIAARLGLCPQTIRNRLTTLRNVYPNCVPTAAQLRKLNIR